MSDEPRFSWGTTLVVLALAAALLFHIREERRERFRACMNEKHDRFVCDTYLRVVP